jgi:hypothetical protein
LGIRQKLTRAYRPQTILSFFCLAMTRQIAASNAPAWKQTLGQLIISGLWFGGAGMLNSLLLTP